MPIRKISEGSKKTTYSDSSGKSITKRQYDYKRSLGESVKKTVSYTPSQPSSGSAGRSKVIIPSAPQAGMVLQYTQDRSKVRYYNPKTKGYTAWISTETGKQTTKPSSKVNLITEPYLKSMGGAVGKESSGIKKQTFKALAATQTGVKTVSRQEELPAEQYIIGYDAQGRPLLLSKGVSQRYKKEVLPEQRRQISEYLKQVARTRPEGETLQESIEKGRVLGAYPIDESKLPVTWRIKRVIASVPQTIKGVSTEAAEYPIETVKSSLNAIGLGILRTGAFASEKIAGIKTRSGVYTDHGKELSASEYLQKEYEKLPGIAKVVSFGAELGTFAAGTKPFTSFKPQIRTVTREKVFPSDKLIKAKAVSMDIRPSWTKRPLVVTRAAAKIKSAKALSGTFNSLLLKGSKIKSGISGRFVSLGKLIHTGKASTGLRFNIYEGIGKLKTIGKYAKGKFIVLKEPKTSRFIFRSGEVFGKGKLSGVWGSQISDKLGAAKFVGIRKYVLNVPKTLWQVKGKPETFLKSLASSGKVKYYSDSFVLYKKGLAGGKIMGKITPAAKSMSGLPEIRISYGLKGLERQKTVLHELIHLFKPTLSEAKVLKLEKSLFTSRSLSTGVSAAATKANRLIVPELSKLSARQDILGSLIAGSAGAAATDVSLKIGAQVFSQKNLQLQNIKPLQKAELKEKQLEKAAIDVKEVPQVTSGVKTYSLSGSAISIGTGSDIIQTPEIRELPKVLPRSSSSLRELTIPNLAQGFSMPNIPLVILPSSSGRRTRYEEEFDILTGFKKFNIPNILLGGGNKTNKKNISFPKLKLAEVKL